MSATFDNPEVLEQDVNGNAATGIAQTFTGLSVDAPPPCYKSVVQRPLSSVEYWHVELDRHDIILAEGLAAESYLDSGNRTRFVNGGAFIEARPEFQPKSWSDTCLPLILEGPEIARAKDALLERLETRGETITSECDLHLRADGEEIEAIRLGESRFAFVLRRDCRDIRMVSRTFIPAHTRPQSSDTRALGICVSRLQIDGEDIALDGQSGFQDGWHEGEPGQRWTQGEAPLPANTRLVVIDLAGRGHYWREGAEFVRRYGDDGEAKARTTPRFQI